MSTSLPVHAPNVSAAKARLAAGYYYRDEVAAQAVIAAITAIHVGRAKCDLAADGWDETDPEQSPHWDGLRDQIAEYIDGDGLEGSLVFERDGDTMAPGHYTLDASGLGVLDILMGVGDADSFKIEGDSGTFTIDGNDGIEPSCIVVQRGQYIVMAVRWNAA